MAKCEMPVKVYFGEIDEIIDEELVDVNEVMRILAGHVKVTTAEPERKTGRWHKRFYFRNSTKSYDCEMHVCSECGNEWSYDAETGVSDYNYCPNCCAKMEGIE